MGIGKNKVIGKIPREKLKYALQKLDEIVKLLEPYLLMLTPGEREALVKIGEESFRFLELSHEIAVNYPDLFPTFMQTAVFKEEFSTVNELWSFVNKINNLKDRINDMKMMAGNHALEFAITFYHTVKLAARHDIPGTKMIFDELKPKFPANKKKRRKPQNNDRQLELF